MQVSCIRGVRHLAKGKQKKMTNRSVSKNKMRVTLEGTGQVSPTATAPLLTGRSGRIGTAAVERNGLSGRTLKLMLVQ